LADVHKALGAGGDQFRRLLQIRGNSEVAREMVERSERQDAKLRFCPGQRRGRGAYCPITAADDQYWVAPLADGLGADLAVASRDQLDLTIDPRRIERFLHLIRDLLIRGDRAAAAVEQDRNRHARLARRADAESRELVTVRIAKIGAVEGARPFVA